MSDAREEARPTIALDVESPDHAANWAPNAEALRAQCPMAWSNEHGGYWVASRHADIVRIVQDEETFKTGKRFDPATGEVEGGVSIPPMPIGRLVPAETDRPEWDRFRNLLNPHFGPKAAEGYRARAETYADLLLDQVIEAGRMDSVQDFTNPLTAMVTLDVLGFPLEEWRTFADPLHALTSLAKSDAAYPAAVAAAGVMDARIDEEIARRRAEPRDDLIGYLVTAEIEGRPIAHADIHQMIVNVLAGGVDTTTALTSNVLVHLWRHPDQRRRLAEDRALLPTAREEFIRYFSPLHGTARTAKAPACIAGQAVEPGERIYIFLASANRDPAVFDAPDEVRLDRSPNRHIGFSAGIHRCLGSFLARIMFDTMMNAVLDRIPEYVIEIDRAKVYPSISPVNGWVNIPMTFPPGTRSGRPEPDWLMARAKAPAARD
jgi:cytochrome P450